MSGLPSGGFARIDNDWLSAMLPSLAIAEALRLYLQAKAGLRQKGADLGELISATGNRDVRHTERAIKKLTASGLIVLVGKLYYAPAASPATVTAATTAQSTAAIPANTSFSHDADAVQDGENQIENSPEEVEEEKKGKEIESLLDGIEPLAPSDRHPATPENENGEAGNLEQAPSLPSLKNPETANLEGEAEASPAPPIPPEFRAAPPSRPAAPRREHHGDDHDVVEYFHRLAGPRFAMDYRLHLTRWAETYTLEFIGLAFKLSPTMSGAKGIFTFVDLLNRDSRRPWPEELKAQYQRDLQAVLNAAAPAPLVVQVRPGDVLRWPDGRTATVERVDSADAVTDAADDERGYVPLSHIGRSVQVIRA